MFNGGMWKVVVALLCVGASAFAQENGTAYQALRAVGRQLGRPALKNVLSVTGAEGNPQPARWRIVLRDRAQGGERQLDVANGQIVSDQPANASGLTTAIETSKLNLDSSGAYSVAAHTAETSHVLFDYVSYTLRNDARGNPTWIVTLETNARQHAGTIHIGANRGNITRVEGMYRGTNTPQVAREESAPPRDVEVQDEASDEDADAADENIIKRRIKQTFHHMKRDAQQMFERVRDSFDDFMNRR